MNFHCHFHFHSLHAHHRTALIQDLVEHPRQHTQDGMGDVGHHRWVEGRLSPVSRGGREGQRRALTHGQGRRVSPIDWGGDRPVCRLLGEGDTGR